MGRNFKKIFGHLPFDEPKKNQWRDFLKIAIRQVRGGSGTDVWSETLCRGIRNAGHGCELDLCSLYYQFAPSLVKLRRKNSDSDITHGNSWSAYAFKDNSPLVVTEHLVVHDPAFNKYRSLSQKIFHRWILRCESNSFEAADAVVCVSQDTRKKMENIFGYLDARIIYNGVDAELFRPQALDKTLWQIPVNKTVLFFAGNMSRRKGADLLPAIMKLLGDEFILLTTAGIRNQSRNDIPHSHDLGHLNIHQLIDVYNLCDIFLLPSRLEGLSLSTLEAMACGKAVVAFNCSSFPELVIDGKGGFLAEKDNVHDIVERIRDLSREPDMVRKMGLFNRECILQKFTLGRMTKEYVELYRSLLV
jgi:glycosyltransferase involved in cell wall biosynthesis